MSIFFLHGLDSSGRGTKGSYFARHFPEVICPDFIGSLQERLVQFSAISADHGQLTLIGSSFGGLMATIFASRYPARVKKLVLLAPALNFADYTPPATRLRVPALIVIGRDDTVTPPALVLPLARETFTDLEVQLTADDHLLHDTFVTLDWPKLLLNP